MAVDNVIIQCGVVLMRWNLVFNVMECALGFCCRNEKSGIFFGVVFWLFVVMGGAGIFFAS